MNFRPTLAFKVSLLLVLNLLLLAGLGAGWFLVRNHADWNTFIGGPPGDRGQIVADQIAVELSSAGAAERAGLLSRYTAEHKADILWIRNDGLILAGSPRPLPPAVVRQLKDNPTDDHGPNPFRARDLGGLARGRFLVWTEPGNYWLGVRLRPPLNGDYPDKPPPPNTLLFRFDSVWPLAMLLGLQWWAGVAALGIGCSILFWLPFVRRVSRRVHRLTETTAQIAEGRFQARAGFGGGDELGTLGVAVDSMAARLETLVEGQKRFLGDAAHELGSPLARMQVAIEILDDQTLDAHKPLVADVREEIQQMSALVNELLEFTRSGLQSRKAELTS
ncbi:MAG: HAMP domain-containing sensor histidine kinase, partial [bacterium]